MLTDEQKMMRLGSIGGSGISKAVANGKTRTDYLYRKASEIIIGHPGPEQTFPYADRGNQFEQEALDYFAYVYKVQLKQVKIRRKTKHKHVTPDSLVIGHNSFVECKVRLPHVFMANKDSGLIETSTRRQIQWSFRVLGRSLAFYIQFCPEMPNPLFVQEIKPDPKEIESLDNGADLFIAEMLALVERHRQ